ncbi:MAG: response regulator transcription factor [Usitatibacteraceae bacterium]
MIRVFIVDDHAILRRGIRDILTDGEGIDVVGEAQDYTELRSKMRNLQIDVLLLDVNLPGKNGIDVLKTLREEHPRIKVLMLSMYPEDQYALRALKAGAWGYLNKASAPEQLLDAVAQVMAGRKFITPAIAQSLADNLSSDTGELPHTKLSDREFQTLCLMASGKRLADIAETLALSPKTVSVYRARILEKMGMSHNAELTHYALKHQLVE